jgi:hypothetical protein
MSVTQGPSASDRIESEPTPGHAVCGFLTSQASWLAHGLDCADDPTAVGVVLARHDASHERWLAVIAQLDLHDEETASQLAGLYAFHGRIAGCLERGPDRRLGPEVHVEVRRLLSRRLSAMTEACAQAVSSPRVLSVPGAASA